MQSVEAWSVTEQAGRLGDRLWYELDADRYPSLGSEFFTNLREKFPRAFQRSAVNSVRQSSVRSSSCASSSDNQSMWSLWDCDGDDDNAIVKEAGGVLVPRSDLSIDERLKHNRDSFSCVRSTGGELLVMLRTFRRTLLAGSNASRPQCSNKNFGVSHSTDNFDSFKDVETNLPTSDLMSRNSCEAKLMPGISKGDLLPCSQSADGMWHAEFERQLTSESAVCGADAKIYGMERTTSINLNVFTHNATLMPDTENQLPSNGVLPEGDIPITGQRDKENQGSVEAGSVQETVTSQSTGFERDVSSSQNQQFPCTTGKPPSHAMSEASQSSDGRQVITNRKPPLVRKGKTQQRNAKSVLCENTRTTNSSTSFVFENNFSEMPGSAEVARRRLQLPWKRKKKKKCYMPGDETNRWRSTFDSWRSSSQLSLDSKTDSEKPANLRRISSQTELPNYDTLSVAWSDSDTDAMSDDPLGGSLNERAARLFSLTSHSVSTSSAADTKRSSGWRSSLRSSARKHASSLQKSAGRHLLRLQKAMNIGNNEQQSDVENDSTPEQQSDECSRTRVRHASDSSNASSWQSTTAVDNPRHFRPIGHVLSYNAADGTTLIELVRPPHGPYGIYLARDGEDIRSSVYISRLSDALPEHFYAGLLRVGDEVMEINSSTVSGLSLDAVFDIIAQSSKLVLRLQPTLAGTSL